MLFFTAAGEVETKLLNMRANIIISFDFKTFVASLDRFDITDRG